jgi:phospholipid transport system transporter-binding protein
VIEVADARMRVRGPMLIDSAAALKKAGDEAVAAGATVVDLAGVGEADSSAVATLLAWVRAAQEAERQLTIVNPPQSIQSLAVLYGVAELLPLA